jgi:hypothetical protein
MLRARQRVAEERGRPERCLSIARGLKEVGCYPSLAIEELARCLQNSQAETDKQATKLAEIRRLQEQLERKRLNVWLFSVFSLPVVCLALVAAPALVNWLLGEIGGEPVLD